MQLLYISSQQYIFFFGWPTLRRLLFQNMHQIAIHYSQADKEKILKLLLPFYLNSNITSTDKNHKCTPISLDLKYPNSPSNPNLNEANNFIVNDSYLNVDLLFSTSLSVSQFITSHDIMKTLTMPLFYV